MRERRLHDLFDALVVRRSRGARERDERRVDPGAWSEHGPRDSVSPRPDGGELHEHRDGSVRLCPGRGKEALANLLLHHHAPQLDRRQGLETLDDDRCGDVVRQIGDELCRDRPERGRVESRRVGERQAHVGTRADRRTQRGLERLVDLDGVDMPHAIGEIRRQHAEARSDLENDVRLVKARQPADHAQDVGVDEKVLTERALG